MRVQSLVFAELVGNYARYYKIFMLTNYYVSVIDPFVMNANLIHDCFPQPFSKLAFAATEVASHINLSDDLVGLEDSVLEYQGLRP